MLKNWDTNAINKLEVIEHQGQIIARIDRTNKIVYKEHFAVVYNNHRLPTKPDPSLGKRHNVQVFVKKGSDSIDSKSIYLPSIGFSSNSPDGSPCTVLANEDYVMIVKVEFYTPKGDQTWVLKTPIKTFVDSEYSNKFFGDFSGRPDDRTEKEGMKNMRHDYQKFVPIKDFEIIERVIPEEDFDIDLGDGVEKEEEEEKVDKDQETLF